MNFNDLLLEIEVDKEWRLIEFEKIEYICNSLDEEGVKIILKSAIPLVYAHWEGFVVTSLRKLHAWLSSLNYSLDKFNINILTLSYEEYLKNLVYSEGYDKRKKHLEIILNNISNNVKFCSKIDVKSNLKFEIIKNELCQKYNFSLENFIKFEKDIDSFLNIRNKIAHGELTMPGYTKYSDIQKYVELLSDFMDVIHKEIEDFCINKRYLKEPNE